MQAWNTWDSCTHTLQARTCTPQKRTEAGRSVRLACIREHNGRENAFCVRNAAPTQTNRIVRDKIKEER